MRTGSFWLTVVDGTRSALKVMPKVDFTHCVYQLVLKLAIDVDAPPKIEIVTGDAVCARTEAPAAALPPTRATASTAAAAAALLRRPICSPLAQLPSWPRRRGGGAIRGSRPPMPRVHEARNIG